MSLEEQIEVVRQEAAAARALAAGADRDAADALEAHRANTGLLSAVRETQREHSLKLAEHDEKFRVLGEKVDSVATKVDSVGAAVYRHGAKLKELSTAAERQVLLANLQDIKLDQIVGMLGHIIDRGSERGSAETSE